MMSYLTDNYFTNAIIASVLGSTEGTFYKTATGQIVDIRATPVMSVGNSGLSFGQTQMDVANNPAAAQLFEDLLDAAYAENRITQAERDDWLTRAATQGIGSSSQAFTSTELSRIQEDVLEPGLDEIKAADAAEFENVLAEIEPVLEAVFEEWGNYGVLDPNDPDFYLALGHLISWANRTGGGLETLQEFLSGGAVQDLDVLLGAPTLADIEYYLENQTYFEEHPGELENVAGNIERGKNLFEDYVDGAFTPATPNVQDPLSCPVPEDYALPSWIPGVATPWGQAENTISPLVLDIDASGTIELVAHSATGSVYWDIDNDGFGEASGWITGGDGLLCADANSDGLITHTELFGNSASYANGYLALDAAYDSNSDNAITSADTNFGNLRVWVDANADGVSQSAELHTLANLGITSISTSYSNVNYTISGNAIKQQSTFTMNGVSRTSVDAWFAYDNVNTEYAGSYNLDIRTLFLPLLRGFGRLPDLRVAAGENETLFGLLTEIASEDVSGLFADSFGLRGKIDEMLYEWAGVASVDPTSRGIYFDARRLSFLEVFLDDLYYGSATSSVAGPAQANLLNQSWNTVVNSMMTGLLAQKMDVQDVVSGVTFDALSQTFSGTGTINFSGIEDLAESLCDGRGDHSKIQVWNAIFSIIDQTIGLANLSSGDQATLMGIVDATTGLDHLTFDLLKPGGNIIWATSAITYISMPASGGLLIDDDGASTIVGGAGDDTYFFAPGFVGTSGQYATLSESTSGGTDTLRVSGVDPEDLRIWTDANYAYFAAAGSSTDVLRLSHQAIYGGSGQDTNQRIERIVFDDGTTWDLTQGIPMTDTDDAHSLYGTPQNDTLDGRGGNDYLYGRHGDDTLYGGDGADYLYGNAGNDHYYGGAGADTLSGDTGDDTYYFAAGFVGTSGQYDALTETTTGGTDTLRFIGVDPDDLRIWSDTNYAYFSIAGNSTDLLRLSHNAIYGGSGQDTNQRIERIAFDDNTVWDLTLGMPMTDTDDAHSLTGTPQNDVLDGRGGADTLYGRNGDDLLYGGSGIDNLYGNSGADTFVFEAASAFSGIDVIRDFSTAQSDKIDIRDVLFGYDPLNGPITDYVEITTGGSNSILKVDRDGTGSTYSLTQIATINGVTGLTDEAALVSSGHLIAA